MAFPLTLAAETTQVEYHLAIDWHEATDGSMVAVDDGAGWDYVTATITARLTPDELSQVNAQRVAGGQFTDESGSYILGPRHAVANQVVRIMEPFRVDQPADSALTLYDVTATLSAELLFPIAGSPAALFPNGVGYQTRHAETRQYTFESGLTGYATATKTSKARATWYAKSIPTYQAAEAVDWLRTLRGGIYALSIPEMTRIFGPDRPSSVGVWIPAWKIIRSGNLTWDFELEVVANG